MALFKPEETKTNSFNGICECTIVDIQDKSAQFDWADIYLQVTLLQNGSKYTRNANIVGGFDKDPNGNVTGGSVIKRMYAFFTTINCNAGINIKGELVNSRPCHNCVDMLKACGIKNSVFK